jgi:hypothetical protein
MRLGKKKHSATDEASTGATESAKSSSGRRKLGSRVKGLFKGRVKRKKRGVGDDESSEVGSDVTSLRGMDEDAAMSHPAAGLTHEMLGIPEEEEEDDANNGGKGSSRGDLNSKDPMDQLSPMEGGVDDKYLGGNYDDLIEKDENSIIVVLLLIDPITLRFELLQLEFDARKAMVSDALAQIPESAMETSIKSQPYKGVIDGKLRPQLGKTLLKSFAKTKDVLVTMAASQSVEEASRLARPILSDEKVVTMVRKMNETNRIAIVPLE